MDRLEDLHSYRILDTDPELELNDLAEIACAIFDTPVSLISFIDDKRQWYKAKIGVDATEMDVENTFCKLTLDKPDEILLIENPLEDPRVKTNPNVTGQPGIRFYASAPLVSSEGNVLGTVCVLDYVEKHFSQSKLEALKLVSTKIMRYLETRKLINLQNQEIEYNAARLKKLTDLVPGVIFKMSFDENKILKLVFVSEGIKLLFPSINLNELKKNPLSLLNYIDEAYRDYVIDLFRQTYEDLQPIDAEYKVNLADGQEKWHWMRANPERRGDNEVVLFGIIQVISQKRNHLHALEKMIFDISHVIRKPISNIMSIANLLQLPGVKKDEKLEMFPIIFKEISELDNSIRNLSDEYNELKKSLKTVWKDQ
jgi:hypothetical protein